MIPTGALTRARSASTASPCESSRWCATVSAVGQSRIPGALRPTACPRIATTHGSLWVIQPCDHVTELVGHRRRVVGEALRGVADRPAAGLLAGLRKIPVIERRDRLDPALQAALDEPPVEGDAARVQRAAPVRLHARPGDREAIGLQPELDHQVEVGRPAVVVIAGDVAGVAVDHGAGLVAEAIPDRLAAPVLARGALDLVRRRRGAEAEARRAARPRDAGSWGAVAVIPSPPLR